MAKDFYAILGVARDATEADIKQAYRKLSRELHPDKHKGDKAKEAKFKEVNEAYEVLSDPKKRAAYDRFGSADFSSQGGGGFGGFGGFDPSQFQDMGGLGDIFETFFGGQRNSQSRRENGTGRTLEAEITISFEEAVKGGERTVELERLLACETCSGTGCLEGSTLSSCTECGGSGTVEQAVRSLFGVIRQRTLCPRCDGSGTVPQKPCKTCHGDGRRSRRSPVTVRIPPGIDDGQALRLQGEGEAGRRGAKSGDLLLRVRVRHDARFERDGDDIRTTLSISVVDAVLGTDISIETVHGPATITIPAGTQPGQILRLKGKGMPVVNTSRHGDHYVTIIVSVPTKLTKEERVHFEALKNDGKR